MIQTQKILDSATHWFITMKAPDLKSRVEEGLQIISEGKSLHGNYKKLFGYIFFAYAMHFGPPTFIECENATKELGVIDEMSDYAKDWLEYKKSV